MSREEKKNRISVIEKAKFEERLQCEKEFRAREEKLKQEFEKIQQSSERSHRERVEKIKQLFVKEIKERQSKKEAFLQQQLKEKTKELNEIKSYIKEVLEYGKETEGVLRNTFEARKQLIAIFEGLLAFEGVIEKNSLSMFQNISSMKQTLEFHFDRIKGKKEGKILAFLTKGEKDQYPELQKSLEKF
jgi:hypothetical protein